jgi:mRNA interferase HicA
MPYAGVVDGRSFIKRVGEIGRERGVAVRVDAKRGKGSHVTLYYGARKTIVKGRRKEIGAGLLASMLRQLGLDRNDFERR